MLNKLYVRVSMEKEILKLLRLAKEILSIEFNTEEEKKKYQKEHEVRPTTRLEVKKDKIKGISDELIDNIIIPYRHKEWEDSEESIQAVKDSGLNFVLPKRSKDRILCKLDVDKFDKQWKNSDERNEMYIGKGGTGNTIGNRYEQFGKWLHTDDRRWKRNPEEPIEVSEISVNEDGSINFLNGRHRYSWLRDNDKPVWAGIEKEQFANALKHGLIVDWVSDSK